MDLDKNSRVRCNNGTHPLSFLEGQPQHNSEEQSNRSTSSRRPLRLDHLRDRGRTRSDSDLSDKNLRCLQFPTRSLRYSAYQCLRSPILRSHLRSNMKMPRGNLPAVESQGTLSFSRPVLQILSRRLHHHFTREARCQIYRFTEAFW